MTDHIENKVVVITGAGGGFGRLVAQKAAARGAKVVLGDINAAGLAETRAAIEAAGGVCRTLRTDVTQLGDMQALAGLAVSEFGALDVMLNNAGIMPLAFYADHEKAGAAWTRCIDINIKGVLHGIMAVHDQMIAQGRGHVVNISSIYGNFPVAGAGVYGATKAAVNFLSDALRVESQGRIKVTTIRPTGVPGTNLGAGVINPGAITGILGQNTESYLGVFADLAEGKVGADKLDPENIAYVALDPGYIADAVIAAIDQPWGVTLSDITVRACGDQYIL
jgi:NADP-dependent 3-hydroxy acid dehydrogenase YdfG